MKPPFCGWRGNESIGRLIRRNLSVFEALGDIYISVVDSSSNVAEMPWAKENARQLSFSSYGGGVIVPGRVITELALQSLFTGFDEIWILDGIKPLLGLVPAGSLVSPLLLGALMRRRAACRGRRRS